MAVQESSPVGPVYTVEEVRMLRGMDKEGLRLVHRVKEVFEGSVVVDVKPEKSA